LLERQPVQITDVLADPEYTPLDVQEDRTVLGIPLLREGVPIGALALTRSRVSPFSDKQIALATTFADQAVIAIENTRLLNELRESLEQQTATSEVLQVISSSPGELERVFQAMLENATRICEADSAALGLCEGDDLRRVARYNAPAALLEQMEREPLLRLGPTSGLGRSIRLKQVVQVPDIVNDQMYFDREPARVRLVEAGYRSQLSVPLIKHNEAIGAFNILRQKTGLFTEKQIELVSNFAKQAVIAIETRGCSTSCASRCSSRPPPPTCSRSSAARRSIFKPCWTRWSNQRPNSARRTTRFCSVAREKPTFGLRTADSPRNMRPTSKTITNATRSSRVAVRWSAGSRWNGDLSRSPTSWLTPSIRGRSRRKSATSVP